MAARLLADWDAQSALSLRTSRATISVALSHPQLQAISLSKKQPKLSQLIEYINVDPLVKPLHEQVQLTRIDRRC